MFVSHSEIEVEEHGADALERAFRERSRLVDGHPGFLGLELLRDIGRKGNYLLVTRWSSRDDFRRYMKSRDFRAAHERQHEGVEEPAGGAPLRQFEAVPLSELP
jgi:heme-degrading monooxygenase HmoA